MAVIHLIILATTCVSLPVRALCVLQMYFAERARGGVGLIVTGGVAPNFTGRVSPFAAQLSFRHQVKEHAIVTQAVHAEGGKIAMQILHAGRYAYHPLSVSHVTVACVVVVLLALS